MMPFNILTKRRVFRVLVLPALLMLGAWFSLPANAQEDAPQQQVQILSGRIEEREIMFYRVPDLQEGDLFSAYMENESGNLDPALLLNVSDIDPDTFREQLRAEIDELVAAGTDPSEALGQVLRANFLAADDNSGQDSAAAFEFTVPETGDYLLLALGTPVNDTFGDFQLIVGINAPQVMTGRAQSTGDEIAFLDKEQSGIATAVEEVTGTLTAEKPVREYTLNDLTSNDTIYAYVETTAGNLIPSLRLEDYSGRVLRDTSTADRPNSASFQFFAGDLLDNYQITVSACCAGGEQTTGDYRLVVGINEPSVLEGQSIPTGRQVLITAIPVEIGAVLQQITGVDQQAENYGGVYLLTMSWTDPRQAFSPDDCRCQFLTYTDSGFTSLTSDEGFIWPEFTLFNQQNQRWVQNRGIIIETNGEMTYFERFTTTLQAPDFDFRAFPFDTQQFFLHVDSLYPENFFVLNGPEELSALGDQLGEEEWAVTEYTTEISSVESIGDNPSDRFSFGFQAHRHLNFYIMRIFLPTILIIIVSYFTFFLQNYSKRIDVTSANLLVFVAFNFTISDNLPRLGYLTFLDAMLAGVFVITAMVVAFNVYLRRLEMTGQEERAKRIDAYTLWVYPVAYLIGGAILTIYFLLPEYWDSILGRIGIG